MAHHKNRRPKSIKGCCGMCACRDHAGGLRNKRLPTLQEQAAAIDDADVHLVGATVVHCGVADAASLPSIVYAYMTDRYCGACWACSPESMEDSVWQALAAS